jgi:hypothetical protein
MIQGYPVSCHKDGKSGHARRCPAHDGGSRAEPPRSGEQGAGILRPGCQQH